jgi:hypothetical protein
MRHPRRNIGIFTATTALLVGLAAGSIGISSSMAATKAAAPAWATYDAKTKTAHLTLISSYGSDTYNYNGGKAGHFTFTVPTGAKVVVTYSNNSTMMPHGAEVVAWTGTLPTALVPPPPAFAGAFSPNYRHGTRNGVTQTFSFVANKAGKYLLICPVHNHVKFGHWGWFVVSGAATTATGVLS